MKKSNSYTLFHSDYRHNKSIGLFFLWNVIFQTNNQTILEEDNAFFESLIKSNFQLDLYKNSIYKTILKFQNYLEPVEIELILQDFKHSMKENVGNGFFHLIPIRGYYNSTYSFDFSLAHFYISFKKNFTKTLISQILSCLLLLREIIPKRILSTFIFNF